MKQFKKPIYVTKPFLPPFSEFCKGLKDIWDNQWLTNNGPTLKYYKGKLKKYFETENVCLFNNGTLALQIALQGMGIRGEVITTPFTFVATTHSLYWNNIRPVFCDIEPDYFTLDPDKVEELITPWTSAILAVHVFGYPCRLEALAKIARRHNLKLIYDAAHAFGVRVDGIPIVSFGDLSMLSFHATKLYHSIEGGMLTFDDPSLTETFDYLKNFGFKNEIDVVMPGTNAKMTEMQALMGLTVLDHVDELIGKSTRQCALYKDLLSSVPGIAFRPDPENNIQYNYAYAPILINENEFGMSRDELYEALKKYNVFTRRYFYPLISDFACYKSVPLSKPLTVASKVATRILTLPIYYDLKLSQVERICDIIKSLQRNRI